ncbi:MAG TPA: hypothetical protein VK886_22985, partial [Vicinamibacterales bacterium]|nr:hypothetical protein [Vicinamibacterales bacterium]
MGLLTLNRKTRWYVSAVVLAGLGAIAESVYRLASQPVDARWLLLAALTLVSGSANFKLTAASATISLSETFVFTSVLLFGAAAGTVTVALDAFVVSLWLKRQNRSELYRLLFNIAAPALSIWIGAQTFFALAGKPPLATFTGPIRVVDLAWPLLTLTLLYFLLNSWLIAFVVSLKDG